jgi:phage tail-like protein
MDEFVPLRFKVTLYSADKAEGKTATGSSQAKQGENREILCGGYFSEVSGLELNMEPKAIREGGRNWGELQRCGQTKFSTIVLKRGVTEINDLWSWFDITTRGAQFGYRMSGRIEVMGNPKAELDGDKRVVGVKPVTVLTWVLNGVLPTKFKGPDLSATSNTVAIEELHLVHEGLQLKRPDGAGS